MCEHEPGADDDQVLGYEERDRVVERGEPPAEGTPQTTRGRRQHDVHAEGIALVGAAGTIALPGPRVGISRH